MAITDLTGTTWCLNHELNISETETTYNINFTSDGSDLTSFTLLIEDYNGQTDHCLIVNGTYWYDAIAYAHNWLRYTRRVWVITGGTDSTNQNLISWLQSNATQIYVTSLLNTQWVISDTPETYVEFSWSGTETAISAALDFNVLSNEDTIYHNLTWQTSTELRYYRSTTATGSNYLAAYSSGWVDVGYRYINITGGNDVSSGFICAWFQTNAIPYVKPVEYVDKVSLPSGDEYYIKDTVSGYLTKEDILSSGSISINETSEGKLSISNTDSGIAGRFIRFGPPTISDLTGTTWLFNSVLDLSGYPSSSNIYQYDTDGTHYNINYTVPGTASVTGFATDNFADGFYLFSSRPTQDSSVYRPQIIYGYSNTDSLTVWSYNYYSEGWYDDAFRTIIITGGSDVTSQEFISWLSANATQVS